MKIPTTPLDPNLDDYKKPEIDPVNNPNTEDEITFKTKTVIGLDGVEKTFGGDAAGRHKPNSISTINDSTSDFATPVGQFELADSDSNDNIDLLGSSTFSSEPIKSETSSSGKPTPPENVFARIPWRIWMFIKNHKRAIAIVAGILFILGSISIGVVGMYLINIYNDPDLDNIAEKATEFKEGSIVYDRNDVELFRYSGDIKREVVGIEEIPEHMQGAIVALEDENFYANDVGIPWKNLIGASFKCFRAVLPGGVRSECRGASGLTQQLVKNVTNDDERSIERKVRELVTAFKFSQEVGETEIEKEDEVLRLYLNWVAFGRNIYGVQEASRSYFGHDINSGDLTIPKACYLASMVQRPSPFAEAIRLEIVNRERRTNGTEEVPNPTWEILEGRKNSCIQKLHDKTLKDHGSEKFILTQEEADKLKEEVVTFKSSAVTSVSYGHLRSYVAEELLNKLDISETELYNNGYQIYTTFDKKTQDETEKILQDSYESRLVPAQANNSSAVVLDGASAEIIALVGSRDFNNLDIGGQVNVATSPRQPGSSYKPYVYTQAFRNGFNPGTTVMDVSTQFESGYRPKNFSGNTRGPVTLRYSLQNSLNIPAVKAAYMANNTNSPSAGNIKSVMQLAADMGVEHTFAGENFENCGVSAALGGCEVTALSHAGGINTLLHEGTYRTPKPLRKVIIDDLDILEARDEIEDLYPESKPLETEIAQQVANVMSDYGARDPGVWGRSRSNLELEGWTGANAVAAKTGTTNDVKDMWTVGGSPHYTVAIWVGNTNGKPMNSKISSSSVAAPIWKDIMTLIHKDKEKVGFKTDNSNLTRVSLDPRSGLIQEGGRSELLTKNQASLLGGASAKFAEEGYDPKTATIFQNRTSVRVKKVKINPLDGKIIDESGNNTSTTAKARGRKVGLANNNPSSDTETNPSENTPQLFEEVECIEYLSEFPSNNWMDPVNQFQQRKATEQGQTPPAEGATITCPTEFSTQSTEGLQPQITLNFEDGEAVPVPIEITAFTPVPDGTISKIEFWLGGELIDSVGNANTLEINTIDLGITGTKDMIVRVIDSFGQEVELIYEGVDFDNVVEPVSSAAASSQTQVSSAAISSSAPVTSSATASSVISSAAASTSSQ